MPRDKEQLFFSVKNNYCTPPKRVSSFQVYVGQYFAAIFLSAVGRGAQTFFSCVPTFFFSPLQYPTQIYCTPLGREIRSPDSPSHPLLSPWPLVITGVAFSPPPAHAISLSYPLESIIHGFNFHVRRSPRFSFPILSTCLEPSSCLMPSLLYSYANFA